MLPRRPAQLRACASEWARVHGLEEASSCSTVGPAPMKPCNDDDDDDDDDTQAPITHRLACAQSHTSVQKHRHHAAARAPYTRGVNWKRGCCNHTHKKGSYCSNQQPSSAKTKRRWTACVAVNFIFSHSCEGSHPGYSLRSEGYMITRIRINRATSPSPPFQKRMCHTCPAHSQPH